LPTHDLHNPNDSKDLTDLHTPSSNSQSDGSQTVSSQKNDTTKARFQVTSRSQEKSESVLIPEDLRYIVEVWPRLSPEVCYNVVRTVKAAVRENLLINEAVSSISNANEDCKAST
jgi:hypothetical protein